MLDSRGISPLIATVLLMAFAVALGGMIMNWSSDIGTKIVLGCKKVVLEETQFCRTDKDVSLNMKNTGEIAVAGLTLKAGTGEEAFEISIPESKIAISDYIRKRVPIVISDGTMVALYASVDQNHEPQQCPEPAQTPKKLPEC